MPSGLVEWVEFIVVIASIISTVATVVVVAAWRVFKIKSSIEDLKKDCNTHRSSCAITNGVRFTAGDDTMKRLEELMKEDRRINEDRHKEIMSQLIKMSKDKGD